MLLHVAVTWDGIEKEKTSNTITTNVTILLLNRFPLREGLSPSSDKELQDFSILSPSEYCQLFAKKGYGGLFEARILLFRTYKPFLCVGGLKFKPSSMYHQKTILS
jgi:hypothetical protein